MTNTVIVKGQSYTVISRESLSHLGARYFGHVRSTLVDSDGTRWIHTGKRVTANAVLRRVDA